MAIKNMNEIEKSLGLSEGTLKGAIENEAEIEVDITGVVIHKKEEYDAMKHLTNDELTTRDNAQYGNGKIAGEEMSWKKTREDEGLDEGLGKSPAAIIAAIKQKALKDANVNPDARVAELTTANTLLVQEKADLTAQAETIKTEYQSQIFMRDQKDGVRRDMGDGKTVIEKNMITDLFFNAFKVEKSEDGKEKFINIATGEPVMNANTHTPEVRANVVKDWMQEKKLYIVEGGSGEGDQGGGGDGTMEAFNAEMIAAGNPVGSLKYNEEMDRRIKSGDLK